MRIRTILPSACVLGGLALLGAAACGRAEAPESEPVAIQAMDETEELAEISGADPEGMDGAEAESGPAPEAALHDDADAHGEDHDHDHGNGRSDTKGDDHVHDHDHDHDDDHAGGAPHVHGVAQLALSLEGDRVTGEMMSPLANFGLSEAEGIITDAVRASLPGLVSLSGGGCVSEAAEAEVDRTSGHADAKVGYSWRCSDAGGVSAVRFTGFTVYPGFETIETVYLSDTGQKAGRLTPSAPELALK